MVLLTKARSVWELADLGSGPTSATDLLSDMGQVTGTLWASFLHLSPYKMI